LFDCVGHGEVLQSFPTRRSSDLNVENVEIYESDGLSAVEEEGFSAILTNPPIRAGKETVFRFYEEASKKIAPGGSLWVVIQKKRSEEHTSELQSRENLVCRLLLE